MLSYDRNLVERLKLRKTISYEYDDDLLKIIKTLVMVAIILILLP